MSKTCTLHFEQPVFRATRQYGTTVKECQYLQFQAQYQSGLFSELTSTGQSSVENSARELSQSKLYESGTLLNCQS